MMNFRLMTIGIAVALISGCGSAPTTVQEFRQSVEGGAGGLKKDSFVVDRSMKDVAGSFRRKAKECLNMDLVRTTNLNSRYGGVSSDMYITYTSTVVHSVNNVEMQVRNKLKGKHLVKLQREPEGGYYILVADVSPIDQSSSKVNIYYSKYKTHLLAGVKNWAEGRTEGCPDLINDI